MSTQSQTTTRTISINTEGVVKTWRPAVLEFGTIIGHLEKLGAAVPRCDLAVILIDLGVLAITHSIRSMSAKVIQNCEIIHEWEYVIANGPLTPSGPDQPPLPHTVGDGATLRITVSKAEHLSDDEFSARLEERGWTFAEQFPYAPGVTATEIGAFCSGGDFALRRVFRTIAPSSTARGRSGNDIGEPR